MCVYVCIYWKNKKLIQVIYELKAGGVDQRRLVGAKLEKLAEGETGNAFAFTIWMWEH